MSRLISLLLVVGGLAGCSAPPATNDACCAAPAPGTANVHINGQVGAGVRVSQ